MKKLLSIALGFSLFALTANAQVERKADPSQKVQRADAHKKDGKMMKDLNLTQEQKDQMKAFHQSMKQQRDAIKNDASLSQEQKKQKMQELNKTQKEKMNSILTTEQQQKMKTERKEWKEKNKDKKLNTRKHHNARFTPNGKDDK